MVLEAVKQNGEAIKFADKYVANIEEILLEALRNNGNAIKFVNEKRRC